MFVWVRPGETCVMEKRPEPPAADGTIFLLIECKAPEVEITQDVFDQIARYNLSAEADWLMLTNGLQHLYYRIDYITKKCQFVPEIPVFSP